jgi:hypothetical protein
MVHLPKYCGIQPSHKAKLVLVSHILILYSINAVIVETSLLLLSLLQSYHQHCHYCRNIAQASLSQSHWQGTALREMFPPFMSYFRWLSDQGQKSFTVVMWCPTKPQSQSCAGFTKSYKTNTNTNTAMTAKILLSLLSLSCCQGIQLWGRCSLL